MNSPWKYIRPELYLDDHLPFEGQIHAIRPYSSNAEDDHLSVVLMSRQNKDTTIKEWVVLTYNIQDKGFCNGVYVQDPEYALSVFCQRGI